MAFTDRSREIELTKILELVGREIQAIGVLAYRDPGGWQPDGDEFQPEDNGLLQLTMQGGDAFHVTGDATDERLQLFSGEYDDPFGGEQPAENLEFVHKHGQWLLVDLSGKEGWADVVGAPIASIEIVEPPPERRGYEAEELRIVVARHTIAVRFAADEVFVSLDNRPASEWIADFDKHSADR